MKIHSIAQSFKGTLQVLDTQNRTTRAVETHVKSQEHSPVIPPVVKNKKSNKKLYIGLGITAALTGLGAIAFHSARLAQKALKEMPPLYFGPVEKEGKEFPLVISQMHMKAKEAKNYINSTLSEMIQNMEKAAETPAKLVKTENGSAIVYPSPKNSTFFEKNDYGEIKRISQVYTDGTIKVQILNGTETIEHQGIAIQKAITKDIISVNPDGSTILMSEVNDARTSCKKLVGLNSDNSLHYFMEDVEIGEDKIPSALKAMLFKNNEPAKYIENKTPKAIKYGELKNCDEVYDIE
ncbi:MAG: hypothetical protein KHX03_02020 [Clostridium sp.]|nr:hypothetical protein [Clostridium sp.]